MNATKFVALFVIVSTVGLSALLFSVAGTRPTNNLTVSDNFPFSEGFGSSSRAPAYFGIVEITVTHGGTVVSRQVIHNLITNAGEDVISRQTACGATSAPACANGGIYIALTTDATAAAATDTACTTEQTLNGLARALGTYTHTTGATSHKIANTFTYTGSTSVVIAKVCMFDASTSGNMVAETVLSSTATVSANGDQVTINWTFNH